MKMEALVAQREIRLYLKNANFNLSAVFPDVKGLFLESFSLSVSERERSAKSRGSKAPQYNVTNPENKCNMRDLTKILKNM
jgi:hypothetical protein